MARVGRKSKKLDVVEEIAALVETKVTLLMSLCHHMHKQDKKKMNLIDVQLNANGVQMVAAWNRVLWGFGGTANKIITRSIQNEVALCAAVITCRCEGQCECESKEERDKAWNYITMDHVKTNTAMNMLLNPGKPIEGDMSYFDVYQEQGKALMVYARFVAFDLDGETLEEQQQKCLKQVERFKTLFKTRMDKYSDNISLLSFFFKKKS